MLSHTDLLGRGRKNTGMAFKETFWRIIGWLLNLKNQRWPPTRPGLKTRTYNQQQQQNIAGNSVSTHCGEYRFTN